MFFCFIGLFLFIFICIKLMSKGYTNDYVIDGKYKVKEIYTKDEQDEHDNYYIEVEVNDIVFNFQIYNEINNKTKVVKDVIYYDGEYKCLMPVLRDNVKVDFLCYKEKNYYTYQSIKGKDEKLDNYISKISKEKYNIDDFKDSNNNSKTIDKITYYPSNIPKKYGLSISNLKGIVNIKEDSKKINLFDKDVYKRELSIYSNNYYLSANYNSNYSFKEVYIVNLNNNKVEKVKTPDMISYDSYIQGVIDDNVYLYDINNENQYKINLKNNSIELIGNSNKGIKYYDGKWSVISSVKANQELKFKINESSFKSFEYVYKNGNKLSGYNYYFYKVDDGYEVYKANVQNIEIKTYLFNVEDYNNIEYIDEYIVYKSGNSIKIYSDNIGIKTIANSKELEFNDNIKFNLYYK